MGFLLNKLKRIYKYLHFKKYSTFGNNFKNGVHADCIADKPGLIEIGHHCEVNGTLYSMDNGRIKIGNNTVIHANTLIGSVKKIEIGNNVIISNNIKIYDNNNHPTDPKIREQMCKESFYGEKWRWTYADRKPVMIEDNVWIGERSTILKGVHIGKGSIVASNSVVVKDVPPYSIVAGNPAKIVKMLEINNGE